MEISSLEKWININSGSNNAPGLRMMADALTAELSGIPGEMERIQPPPQTNFDGSSQPSAEALRLRFNPEAPVRVLFSGHMDTVYGPEHPFQKLAYLPDGRLHGPGVADMKGGLFIMIESVKQFLKEDQTGNLGGEILINADEEIGSPGSHELIIEAARWNHLGLVFESALPGGELVRCRKGTGTFRLQAFGKPAHTGRDFENGRSAIVALSALLMSCHELNTSIPDAIVNVGSISGGGPVNVVPEYAEAYLNIRISQRESVKVIMESLQSLIRQTENTWDGIQFKLEGDFTRTPKVETPGNAFLHEIWNQAESNRGFPKAGKRDTGGTSDGNVLAEVGLPHLDGVGISGGAIHSDEEFAFTESIPAQISKVVAFLHILAENPDALNNPSMEKLSQ